MANIIGWKSNKSSSAFRPNTKRKATAGKAGSAESSYSKVVLGLLGVPKGNRTPVSGVRGQRPRPLDEGDVA